MRLLRLSVLVCSVAIQKCHSPDSQSVAEARSVSRLCDRVTRRASPGLDTDLSGLGLGFINWGTSEGKYYSQTVLHRLPVSPFALASKCHRTLSLQRPHGTAWDFTVGPSKSLSIPENARPDFFVDRDSKSAGTWYLWGFDSPAPS